MSRRERCINQQSAQPWEEAHEWTDGKRLGDAFRSEPSIENLQALREEDFERLVDDAVKYREEQQRDDQAHGADAQVHGVSPDGAKWSAIYKADGTAEYNGGKTGKWRTQGDQFCNRVSGYDEACVAVFKLGNHRYQFTRADGKKGSIVTIE